MGEGKVEEGEEEWEKKGGKGIELGPLIVWATDERKRH